MPESRMDDPTALAWEAAAARSDRLRQGSPGKGHARPCCDGRFGGEGASGRGERCCAHSVIVGDCRWGWQNNKNDSDNNNGNDDDSINNNSKQKQQQLRIHVRRIPLGGFSLLPFNPALGERPRVPRRGHPAVLSDSESLLAEASRKTLMRWYCCTIAAGVQARMPWNRIIPGHPRRTSRR